MQYQAYSRSTGLQEHIIYRYPKTALEFSTHNGSAVLKGFNYLTLGLLLWLPVAHRSFFVFGLSSIVRSFGFRDEREARRAFPFQRKTP